MWWEKKQSFYSTTLSQTPISMTSQALTSDPSSLSMIPPFWPGPALGYILLIFYMGNQNCLVGFRILRLLELILSRVELIKKDFPHENK